MPKELIMKRMINRANMGSIIAQMRARHKAHIIGACFCASTACDS
jgi:hypothetical protein